VDTADSAGREDPDAGGGRDLHRGADGGGAVAGRARADREPERRGVQLRDRTGVGAEHRAELFGVEARDRLAAEDRDRQPLRAGALDIGNATVSSITTFEKDQGVPKQVLNMKAWMGQLRLHSQVTLALDSREFRLGASISDLAITTISSVDLSGNTSQSFELEFNF